MNRDIEGEQNGKKSFKPLHLVSILKDLEIV